MADLTLRERKQQRAREQIIDAAFALFAERGFAQVTVAERAEVGRTTFFRYFGDKQEPVFADEQSIVDGITGAPPAPAAQTLLEALRQLWAVVTPISELMVGDPQRYAAQERLLAANPELMDRSNRKMARIAEACERVLTGRGTDPALALLAAELAIACFRTARRLAAGDASALMPGLQRAVETLTTSLEAS